MGDESIASDGLGDGEDSGTRQRSQIAVKANRRPLLPVSDEHGELMEGKAMVIFLNGDRYIGDMKAGRKHGRGMYVYADLTTYRGVWDEDVLDGVRHPVTEDILPIEVKHLHTKAPSAGPDVLKEEERREERRGSRRTSAKSKTSFQDMKNLDTG